MAPLPPPSHVEGGDCACCMRRLDSVEVFNAMIETVHVAVTFENRLGLEEEAEMIPPGGSHHFQKKVISKGPSKILAPVQSVTVMHSNGYHNLQPTVNSFVVRKLDLHIQMDGSVVQGTEHW